MEALTLDGGADVRFHLELSGEVQPAQIAVNRPPGEQKKVLEVAAVNIAKRNYQKAYLEYWNSTMELTGTGRPVDGFLCPVTAHSAVIPNQSRSMEYTLVTSLLDYTAVVMPVTHVKKEVDLALENELTEYLSEGDKLAQTECELYRSPTAREALSFRDQDK
jgi:amidase